MFSSRPRNDVYDSRQDVSNPLSSYAKFGFHINDTDWPSAEHYYQAMKFDDQAIREQIRQAPHPMDAAKLAKQHKKHIRRDWDRNRSKVTVMTRGTYMKCRTHEEVVTALLKTGDKNIVENNQYDYYWGCGRDARSNNMYGKLILDIRDKLSE